MMTQQSLTDLWALGDRVIAAMYEENSGNQYHRINTIRGRALDALITSVLGPEEE